MRILGPILKLPYQEPILVQPEEDFRSVLPVAEDSMAAPASDDLLTLVLRILEVFQETAAELAGQEETWNTGPGGGSEAIVQFEQFNKEVDLGSIRME